MNVLVAVLALVAGAENPFLAEARTLAAGLEFERCVERLKQAQTQWKSTPGELRDIEVQAGLCHFNLGHRRQTIEHFRTALRIDEGADLPPYSSPKAVELFLDVKRGLLKPPEPMPDTDLPPDAPAKVDLTPHVTPQPPVDLAPPPPFPWKRRAPPMILAGLSLAATATAIGLGVNARALEAHANGAHFESDFVEIGQRAQTSATAASVAWVLAGATLGGAVATFFLIPE